MDPLELQCGGQCSGKGDMSPGGSEHAHLASGLGVASVPSRLTVPLAPQVGSRRVDSMGFLDSLFQLLWAGALCAQPALHLVSGELGLSRVGWGRRGSLRLLSCQPSPALAAPSACPHMLRFLIPLMRLECGWVGQVGGG